MRTNTPQPRRNDAPAVNPPFAVFWFDIAPHLARPPVANRVFFLDRNFFWARVTADAVRGLHGGRRYRGLQHLRRKIQGRKLSAETLGAWAAFHGKLWSRHQRQSGVFAYVLGHNMT